MGADGVRGHRQDALARPYQTLAASFAAWKLFLLAVGIGSCVGDAYDTSGSLAVLGNDGPPPGFGASLVTRFASWDAIYFLTAARRGYRFEQEWAFGAPLAITIRAIIRGMTTDSAADFPGQKQPHTFAHRPAADLRLTLFPMSSPLPPWPCHTGPPTWTRR